MCLKESFLRNNYYFYLKIINLFFQQNNTKNMEYKNFEEALTPFFWVDHEDHASVCLDAGGYKYEIFERRSEEGFEGNGYDWGCLALVFLQEKHPELVDKIRFDPEAGMYCVYSSDKEALKEFSLKFKEACENEVLINDLFSRAELD